MILKGIDEDWAKANPVQVVRDGFGFVFGYVSQDTTGKNLTATDVSNLHAVGLAIGLVYEFNQLSALGGYAQGVVDAQIAIAHARGLGGPNGLGAPVGTALYTAVDWNVQPGQMSTVLGYATGFLDTCVTNGFRSGVYGGYPICAYLSQHNYGGFLWQTFAWSNGAWLAAAAVRQTVNGVHEAGATVDLDESERVDFGQWEAELVKDESIVEDTLFLAESNVDGAIYLCDAMTSRHIDEPKSVDDILALWHSGAINLLVGVGNTASLATDWVDWTYGNSTVEPKCIRTGWYEMAFGTKTATP